IIDIAVAVIYFFNILFNVFILTLELISSPAKSEVLIMLFTLFPTGLIFIVNISSLIMQEKLNNIWNKVQ
ncbi:membrane protein, partial [Brachyspira sp. G79]